MAFGLNQISSGSGSEKGGVWSAYLGGSSVTASLSFTASALGVGVVMSRETWDNGNPCSISGWTLHVSQYNTDTGCRLHIFTKDDPGTGALTITHGNTQTIDCGWDFYEVPSDWATIPIAQSLKATLSGTASFTGTFTNALDTNSALLVAAAWRDSALTGSSANVTTEDRDEAFADGFERLWVGRKVGSSPPQAPLVTASASSNGGCIVAVEIAANTATPADDPTPPAGRKPRLGPQHRRALGAPVRGSIGPSGGTPPDVTPPPPIPNQQPVASFTVSDNAPDAGDTVTLLSTSTDPDGDSLSYLWELAVRPSGSTASLTTPTNSTSSFVASPAGSFRVRLSVTDTPSDHGSSESPSTSQFAQDVVVAGSPGGAVDMKQRWGMQLGAQFGIGWNNGATREIAKRIALMNTWVNDQFFYLRLMTQVSGNSWAFTDPTATYGDGTPSHIPMNRCFVIWTTGSSSWTITCSGQTTQTLAWNATNTQVQSALAALSNVGANNVQVSGTSTNGYMVTFRGVRASTDYTLTANGSGFSTRSLFVMPQFSVNPQDATYVQSPTDPAVTESQINQLANKSGSLWSVTALHAQRIGTNMDRFFLCPAEENVASTWGGYCPTRTSNPTYYSGQLKTAYQNMINEFKTYATANGNTMYVNYDVVLHGQDQYGQPGNWAQASLCYPGGSLVTTIGFHIYPPKNATPSDVSYAIDRLYTYFDPFIANLGKPAASTEYAYGITGYGDNPSNFGQALFAWKQTHAADGTWDHDTYFNAGGGNLSLGSSAFQDNPSSWALFKQQYGG